MAFNMDPFASPAFANKGGSGASTGGGRAAADGGFGLTPAAGGNDPFASPLFSGGVSGGGGTAAAGGFASPNGLNPGGGTAPSTGGFAGSVGGGVSGGGGTAAAGGFASPNGLNPGGGAAPSTGGFAGSVGGGFGGGGGKPGAATGAGFHFGGSGTGGLGGTAGGAALPLDSFSMQPVAAAPAVPPRVLAAAAVSRQNDAFNIPQRSQLDFKSPQQRPSSTQPLTPAGPFSPAPSAFRADAFSSHASNPLATSGGFAGGGLSASRLTTLDAEARPLGAAADRGLAPAEDVARWALVSGLPPGDDHAPVQALQQFGQVTRHVRGGGNFLFVQFGSGPARDHAVAHGHNRLLNGGVLLAVQPLTTALAAALGFEHTLQAAHRHGTSIGAGLAGGGFGGLASPAGLRQRGGLASPSLLSPPSAHGGRAYNPNRALREPSRRHVSLCKKVMRAVFGW